MSAGLRLTGGSLRGRRLTVPAGVRPTEGRVREALFSIWQPRLDGARFLDLFGGSGAVGLEALGRGAETVEFVEASPRTLSALRRNAEIADPGRIRFHRGRLPGWLSRSPARRFDLIFADPPYRFEDFEAFLAALPAWLAPGGELAVEHSIRVELPVPTTLQARARRAYGESCLTFLEPADGAAQ